MKRMFSIAAAVALTAGAVIISPAQAATKPVLTVAIPQAPASFAAADADTDNRGVLYELPYDTLIYTDTKGVQQPLLATSWKYSTDRLTLTLSLRKGVKFIDGAPFNASSVVANIKAFKNGTSPFVGQSSAITSVAQGKDAYTAVIRLSQPDPSLIFSLSRALGLMESQKAIGTAIEKTQPIGSGAYVLDASKTVADSSWTYVPNPGYWDKKVQTWSKIVVKYINDSNAQVNALNSGQVDIANLLNPGTAPALKSAGFSLKQAQSSTQMLTLVDRSGKMGTALKDVRIRQAINYALDRTVLAKACGIGAPATPASSIFPTSSKGYDKALDNLYPYNPEKAKALVAATGLKDIKMPTLDFGPFMPSCWAALTQMTAAVGIELYGAPGTNGRNIFADLQKPTWPLYWFNVPVSAQDWILIQNVIGRDASWNPSMYGTVKSDALIQTIRTSSGAAQVKALKALNAEVTKNAWFAPFAHQSSYLAYQGKRVNVTTSPEKQWPTYPRMVTSK